MNIVFDFGGVLFNWHPPGMLRRELPHVATDEASARHWVGEIFQSYEGDWAAFDRGTVTVPALVDRISTRTGLSPADVQRVVDAVPLELQPKPDTVALLHRLHDAGHALYYLSNMPAPYADILESGNAFFACFTSGVFSGRVHHIKPEPGIFELAARQFGKRPQDLLFLDDHAPNVEAARALGWQAWQFHDAAQTEAQLRQAGLLP
jgi:putative hydrolase of the HAD superfamily